MTVTLRADGVAWSPGYVQQVAGQQGFVPGSVSGRLVLPSGEHHAPALLTLTFDARAALSDEPELAAVHEVTLSLDVPQTPEQAEPFAAWQHAARKLADDLGATLIDDQGHAVTLHAFSSDRARTQADVPRAGVARPGGRLGLRAAAVQLKAPSQADHAPSGSSEQGEHGVNRRRRAVPSRPRPHRGQRQPP